MSNVKERNDKINKKYLKVIAIGGNGVVGRALINSFDLDDMNLYIIDPTLNSNIENLDNDILLSSNMIFITVPTPTTFNATKNRLEHDSSIIEYYLDYIERVKKEESFIGTTQPLIVINSTTIINYQIKYPNLQIIYNPEFIQEATANDDFLNSKVVILGGNISSCIKLREFYKYYTNINKEVVYELCTVQEAINIKYMRNLKQAWNLTFWEMVYDLTPHEKDYLKIKSILDKIPVKENHIIGMDGFRGFGGKCLPKDVMTLTLPENVNVNSDTSDLLLSLITYNNNINARDLN